MIKLRIITSALPYANGSIHIGHLVEYIQTDIIVRFLKLNGEDAIYVCADDTHGTPIQLKAEQLKIKPEELIEKYSKEHQEDFASYNIHFDSYYSTNSQENKKWAEYIFNKLKEQDLIYTKEIEQAYCEHDKRFLPDRFIKGKCPKCGAEDQYGDVCEICNTTYKPTDLNNPYCSICKNTPVRKTSNHYFFKLSILSDELKGWITNNKNLQKEVKNHILQWIETGLEDWDISRDGPYFGFKIPGETDKYFYVWLDAPIGYISSTENYCKQNNLNVKDYWQGDKGKITHFIGKDIMYFHLLFWPAMLKKAGINTPEDIVVHGFLKVNGEKMSKSRGTFLTAREMSKIIEPEHLRFYYAYNLTHNITDIDLDLKDFKERINNELVSSIFNFIYRTLSFANKFLDSKIIKADDKILEEIKGIIDKIKSNYQNYELRQVVQDILKISALGNKYFQEKEAWKLVKENKEEAQKVISVCTSIVKYLIIVLKPIMPKSAELIEKQINTKDLTFNDMKPFEKHTINKAEIIYTKIEDIELNQNKFPLNLRVAKILEIVEHPDAEKLYIMQIDLGTEKRQLIAGLRNYYKKEELLGKHIVVVSNLKTAMLRRQKSQGMLLAGDNGEKVKVLEAPKSNPGDLVYTTTKEVNTKEITIDDVFKLPLKSKDFKAYIGDDILKTDFEDIFIDLKEKGKVR